MMFYSPHLLVSKITNGGNLIGFIYGADGTTPLERGIVKIRNISASTVYKSIESNKLGLFKIEDIRRGLYIVTISTSKGEFISRNLIGIKTNETAKVYFALEVEESHKNEMQPGGAATVIASSDPIMYNSVALSEVPPADPPEDAPGDPPADPPDNPPEDAPGHEKGDDPGDDQGDDPGDEPGDEPGDDPTGEEDAAAEEEEAERERQEEADEIERERLEEEAEILAEEDEDDEEPDPSPSGPGV